MPITLGMKDAAAASGLSVRSLYLAIERGELRSVKVCGRRLIPAKALEAFLLRGQRSKAPAAPESTNAKRGGSRVAATT